MNFSDFERPAPDDLPDDVSPLYYDLVREVDARGGTDNARIIKFCIAYTTYCIRKKDKIVERLAEGRTPNHPSIRKSFADFQDGWIIDNLLVEARDVLADTVKELREASIDPILTEVKNSIAAAKHELAADLGRHSKTLEAKIDAFTPQRKRGWRAVADFILGGIKHAGHLVIAVAFITLIAALIDQLWPTLLQSAVHVVEDVIGIIRK